MRGEMFFSDKKAVQIKVGDDNYDKNRRKTWK